MGDTTDRRREAVARFGLPAALAFLAACSGGPGGGPDAGADDAAGWDDVGGFEVTRPAPPEIPWLEAGQPEVALPRFTPCPPGWREIAEEGSDVVTCDPWPETGAEACTAVDEAHFPGEPGCVRVGSACLPDNDWAVNLPDDVPTRYVLPTGPVDGDGSRAAPFPTIRAALAEVESGTIIAVGKGTYDEIVLLPAGVTLWGACVAETVVASSHEDMTDASIETLGAGSVVRNLRVEGERIGIQVWGAEESLEIRDVIVAQALAMGVEAREGGQVVAENLVVRDMRDPLRAGFGRGLVAASGSRVDATRVVIERNQTVGIGAAGEGTSVTLVDVAVRDTIEEDRGEDAMGYGASAGVGAELRVTRGVFERNHSMGVLSAGAGSVAVLEDVVVRDTLGEIPSAEFGFGLYVGEGGALEGRRVLLERNRDAGVSVRDPDSAVTLEDLVVRDTQSEGSGLARGRGLVATEGAAVRVTRAVFERNREFAVGAARGGTSLELEDVVLRDTLSQESDRTSGRGLLASEEVTARVARAILERNRDVAIIAASAGTLMTIEDVLVRDTQGAEDTGNNGRALHAQEGARIDVARGVFERNHEMAISAVRVDTTMTLTDVVVRDTRSIEGSGLLGRGLLVADQAFVDVRRAVFAGNRDIGISAFYPGAAIALEDVEVRDTLPRACAADWCAGAGCGSGIGAYGGASITADRFLVARSALAGIQLAYGADEEGRRMTEGGTIDLHRGEVSGNTVCGVNVQTEDFEVGRLMDEVVYRDNPRNIDTTGLPVPDPATPTLD